MERQTAISTLAVVFIVVLYIFSLIGYAVSDIVYLSGSTEETSFLTEKSKAQLFESVPGRVLLPVRISIVGESNPVPMAGEVKLARFTINIDNFEPPSPWGGDLSNPYMDIVRSGIGIRFEIIGETNEYLDNLDGVFSLVSEEYEDCILRGGIKKTDNFRSIIFRYAGGNCPLASFDHPVRLNEINFSLVAAPDKLIGKKISFSFYKNIEINTPIGRVLELSTLDPEGAVSWYYLGYIEVHEISETGIIDVGGTLPLDYRQKILDEFGVTIYDNDRLPARGFEIIYNILTKIPRDLFSKEFDTITINGYLNGENNQLVIGELPSITGSINIWPLHSEKQFATILIHELNHAVNSNFKKCKNNSPSCSFMPGTPEREKAGKLATRARLLINAAGDTPTNYIREEVVSHVIAGFGSVVGVNNNSRSFSVSVPVELEEKLSDASEMYLTKPTMEFMSGDNSGEIRKIESYDSVSGIISLKTPLNFIPSHGDQISIYGNSREFFANAPQEFFASISNEWFADSYDVFDRCITAFKNGNDNLINQCLYFMDAYALGDTNTHFFILDDLGNLTKTPFLVYRNGDGLVNGLLIGNTLYIFRLDSNGFVSDYILGDINGNSQLTIVDALLVLKVFVGEIQLTESLFSVADVNLDGFVTAGDANCILLATVNLLQLPCGTNSSISLSVGMNDGGAVKSSNIPILGLKISNESYKDYCGDETCKIEILSSGRVTLKAEPEPGYVFEGWSGACAGSGSRCRLRVRNNEKTSALFARHSPNSPDLIVEKSRIVSFGRVASGKKVTFVGYIKNIGGVTAKPPIEVTLKVDAGNDGTWDAENIKRITSSVNRRRKRQTYRYVWTAESGTHAYEICADSANTVKEQNEENNCRKEIFTVQ